MNSSAPRQAGLFFVHGAATIGSPVTLKSYPGSPMTLGNAAIAHARLSVSCKACGYQAEPDPAEQARWYGAETTVPNWRRRLVCSRCGSRDVDMVVTGTERRGGR